MWLTLVLDSVSREMAGGFSKDYHSNSPDFTYDQKTNYYLMVF